MEASSRPAVGEEKGSSLSLLLPLPLVGLGLVVVVISGEVVGGVGEVPRGGVVFSRSVSVVMASLSIILAVAAGAGKGGGWTAIAVVWDVVVYGSGV